MPARPAKLTRPQSRGLHPRQRLFAELDQACARQVVWIVGPPGAGKTSLISSYLGARRRPHLWYQVDSGDADAATFFHYLRQGLQELTSGRGAAVPLFTSARAGDLPGFSRLFFRSLFGCLPEQAVLVLDNYHEAPGGSAFQSAVLCALEQIPEGINVVCASREVPPSEFARLRSGQHISVIDWQMLRLTLDEARNLSAASAGVGEDEVAALYEQTGGWIAGMSLVLERLRLTGQTQRMSYPQDLDIVFDYFAHELFSTMSQETQDMLVRMSYLPVLSAEMATAITGNSEAGRLLEDLSKRNLFTDQRYGHPTTYQLHSLWRSFLQQQAKQALSAQEQKRLLTSAAALLQTTGQIEAALDLYVQNEAWQAAAQLIRQEADGLVRQGRRQTLRQWTSKLPLEQLERDPDLLYALGIAQFGLHYELARLRLDQAYELFLARGDVPGQIRCASASVDSFFADRASWAGLDPWIDRLVELLNGDDDCPHPDVWVRGHVALAHALLYRRNHSPMLHPVADRLQQFLDTSLPPATQLASATLLIAYHRWCGNADKVDTLIARFAPLATSDALSLGLRAWSLTWFAVHYAYRGELRRAESYLKLLDDAIQGSRLPVHEAEANRVRAQLAMHRFDWPKARQILVETVKPLLPDARPATAALYHQLMATVALWDGLTDEALQHAQAAMQTSTRFGLALNDDLGIPTYAIVLAELGEFRQAREQLRVLQKRMAAAGNHWWLALTDIVEAYIRLKSADRQGARKIVARCLPILKASAYTAGHFLCAPCGPRLLAFALREGIEPQFVRQLIEASGMPCPDPCLEAWPWPVKIRALGRFELVLNGRAYKAPHKKSPHKQLELLRALVAFGSEGCDKIELADAVWPESEGDRAQNALKVNLSRLRTLLGREDAVLVQDGRVRLSRNGCWIDAWAFSDCARRLEAGQPDSTDAKQTALGLYAGELLTGGAEQPWVLAPRERLRRQWLALVNSASTSAQVETKRD